MLKKTITFQDLDGNNLTEDFYFNLSKVEITEMEFDQKVSLVDRLQNIVTAGDPHEILSTFKWILLKAYGIRSIDGKRFIKSPTIAEEFTQTDAYSVLFMELVTNAEASAAFIRGVLPPDLVKDVETDNATLEKVKTNIARGIVDVQLPEPTEKHPTEMTREELLEAIRKKSTDEDEVTRTKRNLEEIRELRKRNEEK